MNIFHKLFDDFAWLYLLIYQIQQQFNMSITEILGNVLTMQLME
ncbi:MAG: hypothetical protein P857_237 [Candidatus Xenolissoclinum pacificiensis L6]|uniref:Uncharacterized protein n=1 Tax=Candidatus Xenolissoclinum pacificiensis L6 TaxID=1401685 RepID=W2UYY0_9RICK|nr:MAG: hypothetical protein P857_237 [Candidatus Xenolissoclinum pacificiensis L6]